VGVVELHTQDVAAASGAKDAAKRQVLDITEYRIFVPKQKFLAE
jgi:hypothetical protein